jgi:hypothetical protein
MRHQETQHPILYEINTRVWLRELSQKAGKTLTLAEIPEEVIAEIVEIGPDLVWLMGVFTVGDVGRALSLSHPGLRRDYNHALPDWMESDVIGSPYAVADYVVSPDLGGPEALAVLRAKLAAHGIGLLLDFVPNHTARDHSWVKEHPEYYVHGSEDDGRDDQNFFLADTHDGTRVLACGRDPYFPGWTDTAQLNYRHKATRRAMTDALLSISRQCDGVRCDMAMLVLEEIFDRTWGARADVPGPDRAQGEFWAQATDEVRAAHPGFLFLAESYWDLEWRLLSLGFDYAYDKVLLDRLKSSEAPHVRGHLTADMEYQERLARFLENHDESRAASLFQGERHKAAAVLTMTSPGMRFFYEGQFEGHTLHLPVQLGRRQQPAPSEDLRAFYRTLRGVLRTHALRHGKPRLLTARPAWSGSGSHQNLIAWRWDAGSRGQFVAVINYSSHQAQGLLPLELRAVEGRAVVLKDLLSGEELHRPGTEIVRAGLSVDFAPWRAAIYRVERA